MSTKCTRADTLNLFSVVDGIIRSPGKFQGEPIYVPYFYAAMVNGYSDEEEDGIAFYEVIQADRDEYPELQNVIRVGLWVDTLGFVHSVISERGKS